MSIRISNEDDIFHLGRISLFDENLTDELRLQCGRPQHLWHGL